MARSVLEAIEMGLWNFDSGNREPVEYPRTGAMPGTRKKVEILAERIQQGLPLWHPWDRDDYDDPTFDA